MNPTPLPLSEAERIAQIAADSASQFLQAGTIGITLFSQIITLVAIVMVFVVIWFLNKRSTSEQLVIKQQASQNAELIVELREENKNAQASREKQVEATNRQADSNEAVNTTLRMFLEKQSMQEDTLDKMNVNILTVVNGFGAVNEGISRIEKAVQDNPADHQTVLEALKGLAEVQDKIFKLIDSRLPERAKTDTPAFPTLPPAPSQVLIDTMRKRATDETPKIIPLDDKPPKDSA